MCIVQLPLLRNKTLDIPIDDILYVEGDGSMSVVYHTDNNKCIKSYVNLMIRDVQVLLCQHHFYRCHKAFIVNINKIVPYGKYPKDKIELSNNMTIPLAKRKRLEFHNVYLNFQRGL